MLRALGTFVVIGLLATGCGGAEAPGTEGADQAPASADLFIAINTDFEGSQWKAAADLVDKFPDGDQGVRELLGSLEDENVDFDRDVKPAVGPEVDIVVTFEGGGEPDVVGLTQPRDRAKLEALLEQGDEPSELEFVDDWAVVADSQAVIDRYKAALDGADPLGDTDAFRKAMGDLPDDALGKIYVNARGLADVVNSEADLETEQALDCTPWGDVTAFGAAIRAEDQGVRFEASAPTDGGDGPENYEAALPGQLPAGALAYFSFNNLADGIRDVIRCAGEKNAEVDRVIAQAELGLGVSLEDDVLPLLEKEGAFVAYPAPAGEQIPILSLILAVDDEERARTTLDKIAERAGGFTDDFGVTDTVVDGIPAKELTFRGEDFSLLYAVFDRKIVVTTAEEGITALRVEGEKLDDDEIYEQALDSADAPEKTAGFAYFNLEAGVDYALQAAAASGDGPPARIRENLEPLQSLLVYGSSDDGEPKAAGLLRVE